MKREIKKLTLKDVAERLQVSSATISNAFNRPDQLSSALRESILSECEQMGYFGPNAAARSLRTGRTGIVGIVLSDELSYSLTDSVASQFLQGLAEVLEENAYNMLLLSSREIEQDVQCRMQSSMVDGFIVYGYKSRQSQHVPWLRPNKNIIAVDSVIPGTTSVNIENYQGARSIAEHAMRHKPKRVAIIGLAMFHADHLSRLADNTLFDFERSISVQRLKGYTEVLELNGIDISNDQIWNIPDNLHDDAYEAARQALDQPERPQLLLCMSDRIAVAAVQAALHMGIDVPNDLHVVGFDGIDECKNQHPSITTVHQQSVNKGRVAAELFLGLREARDVILETELEIRESCP